MDYIVSTNSYKQSIVNNPHREKVEDKIEELKARKELVRSNTVFQYSEKGWVIKWKGAFNARILLQQHKYKEFPDDRVFFIRRFYDHGQYEDKWRARDEEKVKDGRWFDEYPLTLEEIQTGKNAIIGIPPPPPKPKPSIEMIEWLSNLKIEYDFCIYESERWIKFAIEELRDDEAGEYIKILEGLVDNNLDSLAVDKLDYDHKKFRKASYSNISIIYEDTELFNNAGHKIILLHYGGNEKRDLLKLCEFIREIGLQNNNSTEDYSISSISKYSIKAYPRFILDLDDRKKWLDIQKKPFSTNISLSPEQTQILNEFDFPKFINGQAGSGKTTMLFYLFAEIFFAKQNDVITQDIIYLTENPNLLKKAKEELGNLLHHNSRYNGWFNQEVIEQFKNDCFSSFNDLLYYHLIDDEERDKLNGEYIDFKMFKELYNQKSKLPTHITEKYSPEIVWFIIITFIKGYSVKKYLTPEDFKNDRIIPEKDRLNIDPDTYSFVYEKIWQPWYKKYNLGKDYWDRQDLVRYILSSRNKLSKNYFVIFSDESQDFTKIELQLLFKLSSFSNYDLSEAKQIPLLFAGDPFQTVNPTGFNLSNIKRMFYTELKDELNFPLATESFVNDLHFNYRSSKGIVNLANIIQFFRYKYLEIDEVLKPQISKKSYNVNKPSYIELSSITKRDLSEKIQFDIIILPCERGEENNYTQNSKYLSSDYITASPVSVKGEEFDRVILFEFGAEFIKNFGNSVIADLINNKFNSFSKSSQFGISHFFNKLYVSITRARENLVIMDTKEGMQFFWNKLNEKSVLSDINAASKWANEIDAIILEKCEVEELAISDKDNAKIIATNFKESAELLRDPDKMAAAARIYENILKDFNEAIYCKAREFEYNGDFSNAGKLFLKIDQYDTALVCFWIGACWKDLLQYDDLFESKFRQIYSIIAKFMAQTPSTIFNLYDKIEVINNVLTKDSKKIKWKKDFDTKILKDARQELKTNDKETIKNLIRIIEVLVENCVDKYLILAELYFKIENYAEAISYWDQTDKNDGNNYYEAKIKTTKDENNLVVYFNKLDNYNKIVELYRSNPSIKDKDLITNAFIKEDLLEELILVEDLFEPIKLVTQLKRDNNKISKVISICAKLEKEKRINSPEDYSPLIAFSISNILGSNIPNEIEEKGGIIKINRDKYLLLFDTITLVAYSNSALDDKLKEIIKNITNILLVRYQEIRLKLSFIELLFAHEKCSNYNDVIKKQQSLIKVFKYKKPSEDLYNKYKLLLIIMLYKANFYAEKTKASLSSELIGDRIKNSAELEADKNILNDSLASVKTKFFKIISEIETINSEDYDINAEALNKISLINNMKDFENLTLNLNDVVTNKILLAGDKAEETRNEFSNDNRTKEPSSLSHIQMSDLQYNFQLLTSKYEDLRGKYDALLEENRILLKEIIELKDRL